MSAEASTVSIANKGKASVWTEEAKVSPSASHPRSSFTSTRHADLFCFLQYELLLRVIHQLKQGKAIRWSAINMKDRNAKSISNIWTKIGKDIAQLEDLEESGGENTPQSQKSGCKLE